MPSLRTFSAILSARLEEPAIPQGVTPRGIEEYGIEGSERRVAQNGIDLWILGTDLQASHGRHEGGEH